MNIITIDFETFYDQKFSLSKITTEEYIRSELFEVIGLGIKVNEGKTNWLSGSYDELKTYMHDNYDWENSAVLAHNTLFDGAILNWVFDVHPKLYLDTLCMARAVHGVEVGGSLKALAERYGIGEKGTEIVNALGKKRADFSEEELSAYGDYCVNDVELTHRLFRIFMATFPKQELKVIDLTLRMFIAPLLELDIDRLMEHLDGVQEGKEELLERCGVEKEDLMSNNKFANTLLGLGVEPPTKISLRTEKETYAFAKSDEGFKELQIHDNPAIQALVSARLGLKSTLEETRTKRFIDIGFRGKLPVPIKYYAAHTGRWGGMDKVNLQNLPSRGDNAKILKSCIRAPDGYTLVEADSAQIEARVLAWFAMQNDLLKAFRNDEDVYKQMAAKIYNKEVEEVSDGERFIGKTTILGAGYGMGPERFREQLKASTPRVDMTKKECGRVIHTYRTNNAKISGLWDDADFVLQCMAEDEPVGLGRPGVLSVLAEQNAICLPSGLLMSYGGLAGKKDTKGRVQYSYKTRRGQVNIYGGKVVENVCQGIARCVMAEQMLRISKRYRVLLTVHDSVICCVKDSEVGEAARYVSECMKYVPEWAEGLPVRGDVDIGKDYGNCKRWKPEQNQAGHSVA